MKHPRDTAIRRTGPSAPLRWLIEAGHMPGPAQHMRAGFRVLDYGCGHGADVRHLRRLGYDAEGLDPYWLPELHNLAASQRLYDVITCTYVLNVLRSDMEVGGALTTIRSHLKPGGVAFVTVRRDLDADTETQRRVFLDFPLVFDGTDFAIYRVTSAD